MKSIDSEPLYRHGRHYDLQLDPKASRHDVEFYVNQAKKYGQPILELACSLTLPSISFI